MNKDMKSCGLVHKDLLTKDGQDARKVIDEEGIKSIMDKLGTERRAKETELKEAIARRNEFRNKAKTEHNKVLNTSEYIDLDKKVLELKQNINKDSGKLKHIRKLHNVACIAAMSDEEADNRNNVMALLRINRSAYFYAKALARKLKDEFPNGTYEQYKDFMLNDERFKDNFKEKSTMNKKSDRYKDFIENIRDFLYSIGYIMNGSPGSPPTFINVSNLLKKDSSEKEEPNVSNLPKEDSLEKEESNVSNTFIEEKEHEMKETHESTEGIIGTSWTVHNGEISSKTPFLKNAVHQNFDTPDTSRILVHENFVEPHVESTNAHKTTENSKPDTEEKRRIITIVYRHFGLTEKITEAQSAAPERIDVMYKYCPIYIANQYAK
jgi:hypothetical protein